MAERKVWGRLAGVRVKPGQGEMKFPIVARSNEKNRHLRGYGPSASASGESWFRLSFLSSNICRIYAGKSTRFFDRGQLEKRYFYRDTTSPKVAVVGNTGRPLGNLFRCAGVFWLLYLTSVPVPPTN